MKHFIGGFALTTMVMTVYASHWFMDGHSRVGLGMSLFVGSLFGILGGLAAWGLL